MRPVLLFLFVLFHFASFSQDIQFYFGANQHFAYNETASEEIISSTWTPHFTPTDSFLVQQFYHATANSTTEFETYPGIALGMDLDWQLSEKLSFRSGFGLVTTSLYLSQSSFIDRGEPTGKSDTIFVTTNPNTSNPCTFTNTFAEFADVERRPWYTLLALQVPLKLNYQITDRLGIALGATLRTPLASNRRQNTVPIVRETDGQGNELCTYTLHEVNDRTGRDFRDLTLLAEAEVYWWLGNFGLSLGGGKMLSNLFVNEPDTNNSPGFFYNKLVSRPWTGGFKVLYRLGEKAED